MIANAEDHYHACIFIHNSSSHHDTLRCELQNDYTKGSDQYPENSSMALMFHNKHMKSKQPTTASEGTSFVKKIRVEKRGG